LDVHVLLSVWWRASDIENTNGIALVPFFASNAEMGSQENVKHPVQKIFNLSFFSKKTVFIAVLCCQILLGITCPNGEKYTKSPQKTRRP
jgi:hypothetical protein